MYFSYHHLLCISMFFVQVCKVKIQLAFTNIKQVFWRPVSFFDFKRFAKIKKKVTIPDVHFHTLVFLVNLMQVLGSTRRRCKLSKSWPQMDWRMVSQWLLLTLRKLLHAACACLLFVVLQDTKNQHKVSQRHARPISVFCLELPCCTTVLHSVLKSKLMVHK